MVRRAGDSSKCEEAKISLTDLKSYVEDWNLEGQLRQHCHRPEILSRRGASVTIARGRIQASATYHQMYGRRDTFNNSRVPSSNWYTYGVRVTSIGLIFCIQELAHNNSV